MSRPIAVAAWLLGTVSAVSAPAAQPAQTETARPYGPPRPGAANRTPFEVVNRQYAERYGPRRTARRCKRQDGSEILVCGDVSGAGSPYRMPLPDERFVAGERVSHPSEPPRASLATGSCDRPGCGEPSKLGETIGKIITALKGEDPH